MARSFNPDTGKPYPRRRPVDWKTVRRVLAYRQADREIRAEGFIRVRAFAGLKWESPALSHRIIETRIHPDGMGLYVKLEPIN
jgi:hypothetical protein